VDANQVAQKVPLKLSSRIFSTNLLILSGQGIDVIIGMSWMKLNRAVLRLPAVSRIKASLHHVVELKLEDIHVV
jgi:hypothetical protein